MEYVAVASCGYERDQLEMPQYDLDRRAVDIAVFNAQGGRGIAWWPMYNDVEPGSIVLLRLAAHENVNIDDEIISRAANYCNHPNPVLPTHKGVVPVAEGGPAIVFESGYQGLGLVMPGVFTHGKDLIQASIGHMVLFPTWLSVNDLLRVVPTSAAPVLHEALRDPEDPCSSRWGDRRWLHGDLGSVLLDALASSADATFGPEAGARFRCDLDALRTTGSFLRSHPYDARKIDALAAPSRWLGGAEQHIPRTRVVSCDVIGETIADIDQSPTDAGVHPENSQNRALSDAAAVRLRDEDCRFRAVFLGGFAHAEGVERILAAGADGSRPSGLLARLLDLSDEEDDQWSVSLQPGMLPLPAVRETDVRCWLAVAIRIGNRRAFPAGSADLAPRCALIGLLPDDPIDGGRLDSYSFLLAHRMATAIATEAIEAAAGAIRSGEWDESDSATAGVVPRIERRLRAWSGHLSDESLSSMQTDLGILFSRLDRIHSSLDHIADTVPAARIRLLGTAPHARSEEWLGVALAPITSLRGVLHDALERATQLSERARDAFSAVTANETRRTANETRHLLDQTEDARRAIIGAGVVTLLVAALALYTSAAAIPRADSTFLFAPNTKAAAWTVIVLAIALAYGLGIARLARGPRKDEGVPVRGARLPIVLSLSLISFGIIVAALVLLDVLTGSLRIIGLITGVVSFLSAGALGAAAARLEHDGDTRS